MEKAASKKQARPGKVIDSWRTETGEVWEIYVYFKKGIKQYGNRLIGKNGYIITGNSDFNSAKSADVNINLVETRSKRVQK